MAVAGWYTVIMNAVAVTELKNHLSEYVRRARKGEVIRVTSRGEVVAELRPPLEASPEELPPGLRELIRTGRATKGRRNDPTAYPSLPRALAHGSVLELLDQERDDR